MEKPYKVTKHAIQLELEDRIYEPFENLVSDEDSPSCSEMLFATSLTMSRLRLALEASPFLDCSESFGHADAFAAAASGE